jgi:hypothetical protein
MNNKLTHLDTTASIHTHHAPQLELQAVGGSIRLRRKADGLEVIRSETVQDVITIRKLETL